MAWRGMSFVTLPLACCLHVRVCVFEVVVATVAFGMGIGEVIDPSSLYILYVLKVLSFECKKNSWELSWKVKSDHQ